MSLDHLPASIEQGVQRFADELHISHEEALLRLIETGLTAQRVTIPSLAPGHKETPAELVARLRAQKAIKGDGPQPPLRTDNPERIIGLFANAPELFDSILEVVNARSLRYADLT